MVEIAKHPDICGPEPMPPKKIVLELTPMDVTIMLEALGDKQNRLMDCAMPTKAIRIVVNKIYRAMGVRL